MFGLINLGERNMKMYVLECDVEMNMQGLGCDVANPPLEDTKDLSWEN